MFGLLNKGGADTLPLSRFHFGGIGTKMMQTVMKQNRMPGVPELMETARAIRLDSWKAILETTNSPIALYDLRRFLY